MVGRPYTTAGGKNAHVRVQLGEKPGVTEVRMWGAYEKVIVQRALGEGKDDTTATGFHDRFAVPARLGCDGSC